MNNVMYSLYIIVTHKGKTHEVGTDIVDEM